MNDGNKECRLRICNELILKRRQTDFLPRMITMDESWVYFENKGTFSQNRCWAGGDIQPVSNVRRTLSPNKRMLVIYLLLLI